jgi:hypothetical protein
MDSPAACGHGRALLGDRNENVKKKENDRETRDEVVFDWGQLFVELRDVIDAALNVAGKLASYAEEWDAIENVREFAYDWIAGRPAQVKVSDLLIALGTIFSAIEIDTGIDSVELLAPLRTLLDTPSRLPAWLRCPGADSDEKPTVVIRRFPGRRNCAAPITQLAA